MSHETPHRAASKAPLEVPWVRRKLIHELARGEKTQTQLGQEYRVDQSAISLFNTRHADKIDAVRGDLENQFAGLWVAEKRNRLATLEDLVEKVQELVDDPATRMDAARHIKDLLRGVSEELGQIPNRATIQVAQPVTVRLEGVDTDAL